MKSRMTAIAVGALLVLALAPPASADHGYQSFKFTNKTSKKVYRVRVEFDRGLSHIGDKENTWPGATCELRGANKVVQCTSNTRLNPDDSFTLSVATPPKNDGSYDRAKIKEWVWKDKDDRYVGRLRHGCTRSNGCKDLGVQT